MQELVIKPRKRLNINLKEMVAYREPFLYFAWRDVKVRYKQTAIGALWAIWSYMAGTTDLTGLHGPKVKEAQLYTCRVMATWFYMTQVSVQYGIVKLLGEFNDCHTK